MASRLVKPPGSGSNSPRSLLRGLTVMLTSLTLASAVVVLANASSGPNASSNMNPAKDRGAPDLILINGKISTVDAQGSTVQALAISDGKILATGRNGPIAALAGSGTEVVNLQGRRVLPGLIDGHLHGMRTGYHCWTQTVRLDLVTSRAEALAAYAAKADQLDDGRWIWTTAGGWHLNQLDVPSVFTFDELTAAAPDNPVWVTGTGFAGPRVNQATLDVLGLSAGSAGVTLDANGKPTGQLTAPATTAANNAILAQLNNLGIEGEAQCLADFIEEANSRGMTAWKDAGGNNAPWATTGAISDGLHVEEPAMWLKRTEGLNARIAYHQMSSYLGAGRAIEDMRNAVGFLGDDYYRYLGPGEDTMATDPLYLDFTRFAASKRISVETHVGNLDKILDGFEAGDTVYPVDELSWRIAHPENGQPNDEQLARSVALGSGWALTFSSVRSGGSGPRFRTVMESGLPTCLATDAMNVAPWAPFQNLWYVTTGDTLLPGVSGVPAAQQLTRMEALRLATADCAWSIDQADRLGSLEPGKHADLIVLDQDYFTVPDDAVKDITSLMTIVDGRVVHAEGSFAKFAS